MNRTITLDCGHVVRSKFASELLPKAGQLMACLQCMKTRVVVTINPTTQEQENSPMNKIEQIEQQIEMHQKLVAELHIQLETLKNRPAKPEPDSDGNCVVFFQKRFSGVREPYTYVAIRIPASGKWCVTGTGNSRYTWDDLLDFISMNGALVGKIWVATEWEEA